MLLPLGDMEAEGMCLKARYSRAVMWAMLTLAPHDEPNGRPLGPRSIAFVKSAHKGRSPNHPVPDKQVVQCGVIIPHQNGFHAYAEEHKCDRPSRMGKGRENKEAIDALLM